MSEQLTTPATPADPSVIEAFAGAIDRSFESLFPLNLKRWSVFTVTIWLSGLAALVVSAGGVFGAMGFFSGAIPEVALMLPKLDELDAFDPREFFQSQEVSEMFWVLWGSLVTVTLLVGLIAFFAAARGKMLFLHNLVSLEDKLEEPWDRFAKESNSLFRLYYIIFFLFFMTAAGLFAFRWVQFVANVSAETSVQGVITDYGLSLLGEALALFPIGLLILCFFAITNDFVVPIMYKRRVGWLRGWAFFMPIFRKWPGTFLFYFGVRIVCFFVIQFFIQSIYGMLWCVFCLPAIPVLNRAPFIPLDLFMRAFPLLLLEKMDGEYAILQPIVKSGESGFLSYTGDRQPNEIRPSQ